MYVDTYTYLRTYSSPEYESMETKGKPQRRGGKGPIKMYVYVFIYVRMCTSVCICMCK
jgi:hypothetical protein